MLPVNAACRKGEGTSIDTLIVLGLCGLIFVCFGLQIVDLSNVN